MSSDKNKMVCPVILSAILDMGIRRRGQNPERILKPYIREGMTALDLGCGTGFFTIDMAKLVGPTGKVVAADLQDGMLDILRKKIDRAGLKNIFPYKTPQDKLGLTEKFDFVLIFYVLHEIPDQAALLKEIKEMLKPDGKVLIVEPKFHVSKKAFSKSIETIKSIGFNILDEPRILFSRSVVISN
jgi:ubiquinone/menaquinone biosynthesis C-methylase UbiE